MDGIPGELLKCAIGPVSVALRQLFTKVWRSGIVPADWRDGTIITLYKGKGSKNPSIHLIRRLRCTYCRLWCE